VAGGCVEQLLLVLLDDRAGGREIHHVDHGRAAPGRIVSAFRD
jgi:hypothetical protein